MTARSDSALNWYGLFCVKGLGPKRLHAIYQATRESQVGVDELLRADWDDFHRLVPSLSRSLFDAVQALDWEQATTEYHQLGEKDIKLVHLGHDDYPEQVIQRVNEAAPALLFCAGNTKLLKAKSVAIVGSRGASPKGLELAGQLAATLAREGKNVISGYARGVDTEAHQGALRQDGTTTIVLSTGILAFSPKKVFEDVYWQRDVLVVSQFHPSDKWRAANAMIRNSLLCALSGAVIVIEAGEERDDEGKMSGTFAAGKAALEMGVPLLVLAPDLLEKPPEGNRQLIAAGGVPFRPDDGIGSVLEHLQQPVTPGKRCDEPPTLFD